MKKLLFAVIVLAATVFTGFAQSAPNDQNKTPRRGILLLAHGGSLAWNEEVRHVADQVDLEIPTEVAFGMATRSAIQAAIDRLVARKVTEIVAVPLFISSHSSVIESQAYLLGLRTKAPEDLKDFAAMDYGAMDGSMDHMAMNDPASTDAAMKPVKSPVPIRMAKALDSHPIVGDILVDRAASISKDPSHEVVILIAHGPVPDDDNRLWLRDMETLAAQMRKTTHYAAIESLTLRDDADDPVRNAATAQLRQKVEEITKQGNSVLIDPLLLSFGGIEGGLKKRLDGLTYKLPTQALLPDKRIANWALDTARDDVHLEP